MFVNIGSDNGLVPDGTKPLSGPILTYHQHEPLPIVPKHLNAVEINHKMYLRLIFLKCQLLFPVANGLILINNKQSMGDNQANISKLIPSNI